MHSASYKLCTSAQHDISSISLDPYCSLVPRPSSLCPQKKIRERKTWYNLSRDWLHRLWSISLGWALFDLHPRILNMQTCLPTISTTPKLPASTAGKGCSKGTSAGAQKLHACLLPSFTRWVAGGVVAEYAHAQLSRVYLPSTCDITHVITYTRPSSRLLFFG